MRWVGDLYMIMPINHIQRSGNCFR